MIDPGFSVSRRLLSSSEFDAVFKDNQLKVSTPEFLILAAKNSLGLSRLGMVVSKKNTPRAVDRNRLKRLIREAFRKTCITPMDIVVLTRSNANKQSKQTLASILAESFSKVAVKAGNSVT